MVYQLHPQNDRKGGRESASLMPTYDKQCTCGHSQETRCKYTDTILCPKCGEVMTNRPVSGSFRLTGSGWYRDGYSK